MGHLRLILSLGVPLWLGCLVESPQESEPAVQGDYEDGDEEHRPGQPCLLCHSSEGHFPSAPGEETFEIAGTIFGQIDDQEDEGLRDVEVFFTDARGDQFSALTNRAGNFIVKVEDDIGVPRRKSKGVLEVPREPLYPLEVAIRRGVDEQRMKTKIWRNGSCAHCHGPEPGVDSVGRVHLFDRTIFP